VLTVVVRDEPATQGSKRAYPVRKGGRPTGQVAVVDDNKAALRSWREAVRQEAVKAIQAAEALGEVRTGPYPLAGPVILGVTFTVRKPKSAPKTRVTWPEKQPDLDKLLRAVKDALRAAGVYRDDAQVVETVRLGKFYPNRTDDAVLPSTIRDAGIMLCMALTRCDVLCTPGAVIRVASIHEFPGVEGA
jgi:Holliday junction resolvase RusA-like endonuclease